MAKGNPFLGTVSGSFGDLTLKNYRGKQVLTRKSTKPHNPRTSKQIYQRMFFATVGKARAAFKNIIDHSFEQVPHGVDSLNYFQKRNIALLREGTVYDYAKQSWVNPNMSFVAPKASYFSINPYRISEGSLIHLSAAKPFLPDLHEGDGYVKQYNAEACVPWISNDFESREGYKDTISFQLDDLGFKKGDFLTLVFVSTKKQEKSDGVKTLVLHFIRYKVVTLDSTVPNPDEKKFLGLLASNVDGLDWNIPDEIHGMPNGSIEFIAKSVDTTVTYMPYLDLTKRYSVEGSFDKIINGSSEEFDSSFIPVLTADDIVVAAAWIHSRPDGDIILTSTQDLILADPSGSRIPFNLDLESAFELWSKQGKAIGDARYLLEGGDA